MRVGIGQACDPSDLQCQLDQLPVQSTGSANLAIATENAALSAAAGSPSTWVIVALVAAGALLFMGAGKR
jgi:hypothetical protein